MPTIRCNRVFDSSHAIFISVWRAKTTEGKYFTVIEPNAIEAFYPSAKPMDYVRFDFDCYSKLLRTPCTNMNRPI